MWHNEEIAIGWQRTFWDIYILKKKKKLGRFLSLSSKAFPRLVDRPSRRSTVWGMSLSVSHSYQAEGMAPAIKWFIKPHGCYQLRDHTESIYQVTVQVPNISQCLSAAHHSELINEKQKKTTRWPRPCSSQSVNCKSFKICRHKQMF